MNSMDNEQRCGTCAHYEKTGIEFGSCRHPITELMRGLTRYGMIPAAFSELEVTTIKPNFGKDCPTWHAK